MDTHYPVDWDSHDALDTVSLVAPNIFITNWESSNNPNVLKKYDIKGVITVERTNKPNDIVLFMRKNYIKFLQFKLDDIPSEPIQQYLDIAATFIDSIVSKGENVLVHCAAGISRSASIIVYYLARKLVRTGVNPIDAVNLIIDEIRRLRPINPNPGFIKQIIDELHKVHSKNSRKEGDNYNLNYHNIHEMSTCDVFVDSTGAPGNVICLTDADFDDNGNLVNFKDMDGVIFYFGDWCSWCKRTKPEFAAFSNAIKGKPLRAFVVNSDKNKALLSRIKPETWGYEVRGFPTIVGYSKGKFYAEYADDDKTQFRTAKSFLDFAQGLGSGEISWQ